MIARVAVGVAGLLLALGAFMVAVFPLVVFMSGLTNECLFDGGAGDCYPVGERVLIAGWGAAGLAVIAGLVYTGGAGVYWAFTGRLAPGAVLVGVVTPVLGFLVGLPFLAAL